MRAQIKINRCPRSDCVILIFIIFGTKTNQKDPPFRRNIRNKDCKKGKVAKSKKCHKFRPKKAGKKDNKKTLKMHQNETQTRHQSALEAVEMLAEKLIGLMLTYGQIDTA